jgi:hypothetical protein
MLKQAKKLSEMNAKNCTMASRSKQRQKPKQRQKRSSIAKATAEAKLAALGLTTDDLKALGIQLTERYVVTNGYNI